MKGTVDIIYINLNNANNFIIKFASIFFNFFWKVISSPFFLYPLAALFFVCLWGWIFREYKKWNQGWLSVLIEQDILETKKKIKKIKEKKKIGAYLNKKIIPRVLNQIKLFLLEAINTVHCYIKDRVPKDLKNFYFPSLTSFVAILSFFVLIFFSTHIGVNYDIFFNIDKLLGFIFRGIEATDLSNVVSIITGLVSMAFALVIFIAETIRDGGKSSEQKKFLLSSSFLWPIVTFTILSLLNFVWFKVTILSLILPILLAAMIIYSFWQVIRNLIDPEFCEKNRSKLLKDRIKRIVFDSVKERVGNNILLNKVGLDKNIKIEYTFSKEWLDKGSGDYKFIESKEEGWLSDINIVGLERLAKYLEKVAQDMGFSIYQQMPLVAADQEGRAIEPQQQKVVVKKVYLLKRYGEYLPVSSIFTKDSKIIIALPKEFSVDPYVIDYVKEQVSHIFLFKKTDPSSEVFRRELQGIKDQLVSAIKSISLGSIDSLKQTYLNLAEIFLETLHDFGGGFTSEQARKERGNFFSGWNEIRWLNRDIRELLIVASSTDNRDVISDIAFLPITIAIRAIQAKDHLLFQEFVGFSSFLYYLTKDKPDGDIKSMMRDRSWRYLKELTEIYIEPRLKDRSNEEDAESLKNYCDFAIHILKIFQELLKNSFDNRDIKTFNDILGEFLRLFRHFDPENDYPTSEDLERNLQFISVEEERNKIIEKIPYQRAKEKIGHNIKLSKDQVIFGITAKIFDQYCKDPTDKIVKIFFDELISKLADNIIHLTEVFDSSRERDSWGWDDWEIVADGEAHFIDVEGKLDKLYCVKSLMILSGMEKTVIDSTELPFSRKLAFLAEDRPGTLISLLNSIALDPIQWNFVLSQSAIDIIPALKNLLIKAKNAQERSEEEYLKTAKIDSVKLTEFKSKIKESFYSSGYLRPVLIRFGIYEDLTSNNPEAEVPSWGNNQLDEKAAFIKDWHVQYVGWGDNYGRGMANSEDQLIFGKIVGGITNIKEIKKQEIMSEIEKILSENKFENPVILQTLDRLYEYDFVRKSEKFIPRYSAECPKLGLEASNGYMGVININGNNVPIIDLFIREEGLKNKIVVADLSRFGILNQYSPIDRAEDANYKDDIFFIKVTDLNEDNQRRQKIITENPVWLQTYDDKEGYLRQRVVVNLYQKFKFEIKDSKKAFCINVNGL
jgi:hypothetical protein